MKSSADACHANSSVFKKVTQGDRPGRPEGAEGVWFTDDIWEVLERCWVPTPENRPSIDDVLRCLGKTSKSRIPPSLAPPFPATPTPGPSTRRVPYQNTTARADASGMNPIETLLQLDGSSPHFPDQLSDILARREFGNSIQSLETNDLMQIIEYLDKVLWSFRCFRSLI